MSLEKFLKREPLNDDMARLMAGEEVEPEPAETAPKSLLTEDNREHLRRLLLEPGWRVLLELLDSEISEREDAAKRMSIMSPFEVSLNMLWAEVAYAKKARTRIVQLAETEIQKIKAAK